MGTSVGSCDGSEPYHHTIPCSLNGKVGKMQEIEQCRVNAKIKLQNRPPVPFGPVVDQIFIISEKPEACKLRNEGPCGYWRRWYVGQLVQLFAGVVNRWPHNALQLMPINCYFPDGKAPLDSALISFPIFYLCHSFSATNIKFSRGYQNLAIRPLTVFLSRCLLYSQVDSNCQAAAPTDEQLSAVFLKNLVMNVFRDGVFGSFRHIPLLSGYLSYKHFA